MTNRVYKLANENIIMAAGGPMGSPTTVRWTKLFNTRALAKLFAQGEMVEDGRKEEIIWRENGTYSASQDLGDRQYVITKELVF